jgi:parallel beta-helix repeat protein
MRNKLLRKGLVLGIIFLFFGSYLLQQGIHSVKADPTDGLICYWNYNEGSGTVAHDSSGYENDGTIVGTSWVSGVFGSGLEITDTDYVGGIPSSYDDSISNALTFTAWVKSYEPNGNIQSIIFDGREDSWGWGSYFMIFIDQTTAKLGCVIKKYGSVIYSESSIPTDGTWTHITFVFNDSSNMMSIFINGILDNTTTTADFYYNSGEQPFIGNNHWAVGDNQWAPLNGVLDEVRLYNRALTVDEIQELSMQPTMVYVDDDYTSSTPGWGYDHFSSIQTGVDAVDVGGTIFVYSGVYDEPVSNQALVRITKSLNLIGENKENTIIDVFYQITEIYGIVIGNYVNDVKISDFTVQGNYQEQSMGIINDQYGGSNLTVENCIVHTFGRGGIAVYDSTNCIIRNCIVYNILTLAGIFIPGGSNNEIYNCTTYSNSEGIRLQGTNYNKVHDNNINQNDKGVYAWYGGSNNQLYYNNFINNTQNAFDDGIDIWYNTVNLRGNYWGDYTGEDNNGDSIGDTPYNIPGGSNQDLYPLMTSYGQPQADFTTITNDKTVTFNASFSYDYDGVINNYNWDFGDQTSGQGQIITHTYSTYQPYTVTLTVTDDDGKTDTISTEVSIEDFILPEISNIQDSPDPQHIGHPVNISCLVIDNVAISTVKVHITSPDSSTTNQTMNYHPTTHVAYLNSTYSIEGTYEYFIWANDTSGNTNISSQYFFNIINNHPNIPSNPSPINGATNIDTTVILSWTGGDPDPGDTVTYNVYFGTSTAPPQVGFNQSSTSYNPPEDLSYNTQYYWKIVAWDNHGASTTSPIWHFTTIEQNYPPEAPLINGPTSGNAGEVYTYTFVAVDPNDDNIYYEINWGDGQIDDWYGPCGSDVVITRTHTWEEKGTYIIQARAKDIYNANGPWGSLSVTMPTDFELGYRSSQQIISFQLKKIIS